MALQVKLVPNPLLEFSYYDSLSGVVLNLDSPVSNDLSGLSANALINIANAVNDGRLEVLTGVLPVAPNSLVPVTVNGAVSAIGQTFDGSGNLKVTGVLVASAGSITSAGVSGTLAQTIQGIPNGVPVPVTGTLSFGGTGIAVTNLPTIQPVSGTVNVGNFPGSTTVSGSISLADGVTVSRLAGVDYGGVQYVSSGGNATAVLNASGTIVVSGTPGRLCRVLVTTAAAGSGTIIFYDNASAASGTIIGIIPSTATASGIPFDLQFKASNGITASVGANSATVTVGYSS